MLLLDNHIFYTQIILNIGSTVYTPMKVSNPHKILLLFLLVLLPLPAAGQQENIRNKNEANGEEIKLGLALSGGGAKGFAHIGVLKVLEEEGIPVHMISGTSMGSIIGSLYAVGYTAREIEQIVLDLNWNVLFNDNFQINSQNITRRVKRNNSYLFTFPINNNKVSLPTGLIDGQNISMLLYRLMLPYHNVTDFTRLPIPFSAVATNLSTGEATTFTEGYLADAVRASIAIPSVFKPVKINGKTYIDGGVVRNIPSEDVRKLGANLVIASDVGEPTQPVDSLKTFVDILFQSIGFHQKESDNHQKAQTDFYIRPDITKFSTFSFDQAKEIIKRGEQAARRALPDIKRKIRNQKVAPSTFEPISPNKREPLLISEINFNNITSLAQQQQMAVAIDMNLPARLTYAQIEDKINRLYSSGLFNQISYRLRKDRKGDGYRLVLEFQHREQTFAGLSMRYDSKYKAALLFGVTSTDNFSWNDLLNVQLRVGEILELKSNYNIPLTLAPLSQANAGLSVQRSPISYYDQSQVLSSIEVEMLTLQTSGSLHPRPYSSFELGLQTELYNLNEAIGNTLVLGNIDLLLIPYFRIDLNTLNRPKFATRGQSLDLNAVISDQSWGSSADFRQISGKWFSTVPLLAGVNFSNELFAGYTSGDEPPLHYYYYLGGITQNPVFQLRQLPFKGHPTQQLRSSNVTAIRSELQIRLNKDFYLTGGVNLAHLSDQWTFNISDDQLEYGYNLSLGATSIVGPIELSLSTPDFTGGYAVKLDMGYQF